MLEAEVQNLIDESMSLEADGFLSEPITTGRALSHFVDLLMVMRSAILRVAREVDAIQAAQGGA